MSLRPSVLLLLALLGLSQCDIMTDSPTPADTLPPASQTGAGTAGCIRDGQPWTARINTFGIPSSGAVGAVSDNPPKGPHRLSLSFQKIVDDKSVTNNDTYIEMELPDVSHPGRYVFDQTPTHLGVIGLIGTPAYLTFTDHHTLPEQLCYTGPTATGYLLVTRFDTAAHVISGTFEFTARSDQSGRTVHATEGRFDCKLN